MKAQSTSALDVQPADMIKVVSPEAINYFVDELSELYLPAAFVEQHKDIYDVKLWDARNRLSGKFGRFVVMTEDGQRIEPDVLLMGSVIGVGGLDRDGFLQSLRHYEFHDSVYGALIQRGVAKDEWLHVHAVDFGSTRIALSESGEVAEVVVGGYSIDYGRADAIGRAATCELFQQLLGDGVAVTNSEPEPRSHNRVMHKK